MSSRTIREVLGDRPLCSVAAQASLRDAAMTMVAGDVGAVAVIENGELAGILTERDIVFRGVGRDLPMDQTTAAEIMTREPVTVDIEDPFSDTLAAKIGEAFRHLPVLEGGQVVGILSFRDIPAEYVMMFERFREMSSARLGD